MEYCCITQSIVICKKSILQEGTHLWLKLHQRIRKSPTSGWNMQHAMLEISPYIIYPRIVALNYNKLTPLYLSDLVEHINLKIQLLIFLFSSSKKKQ